MNNNLSELDSVKTPDEPNDYIDRQINFLRWEAHFFGVAILVLLLIFALLS